MTTALWLGGAVTDVAGLHDELRPLMFSIAYRMLGSVAEAEDVVQEAFLRIHRRARAGEQVETPDAYATTITTRLAIDALRSAKRRRESYVGDWLPEPVLDSDADPARRIEMDETVTVAFLVVLERLTPVERAVFLLREVFGYGYRDIADVVRKSEANCRQLMNRARRRLEQPPVLSHGKPGGGPTALRGGSPRSDRHGGSPRPGARGESPERGAKLSEVFRAALQGGDLAELERILAEDVIFYADGGGKAPAVRKPLHGAPKVARFLISLARVGGRAGVRYDIERVNGQPGLRVRSADGEVLSVLTLHVVGDRVAALHNQINPDKLTHLGPVGDLSALLGDRSLRE